MPTQERIGPAAVIDRLLGQPQSFGFFQALRLLERYNAHRPAGMAWSVQFRNSVAVGFPASEIEAIEPLPRRATGPASTSGPDADPCPSSPQADGPRAPVDAPQIGQPTAVDNAGALGGVRITPAFMSLLGVHGALPLAYTEKVASRETYQRDRAPRAFLDVFFDRLCVLMHEAWKKYRPALRYEADPRDEFTPLVLALAGLGGPSLRDRLGGPEGGVQDESLAYYAAALRQRPPSADWMARVATDYFGVPIRVEPFVGRWYPIPQAHRALLGAGAGLGTQSVLGERVYQRDLCLRLHIGPLTARDYQRFLPGGGGWADLARLLGLMTGASFEYEVQLSLCQEAVRPATLGGGARLGWDAFVLTRPASRARTDAGYAISPLAADAPLARTPRGARPSGAPSPGHAPAGEASHERVPPAHGPHHAAAPRPVTAAADRAVDPKDHEAPAVPTAVTPSRPPPQPLAMA